jgi:hypothetical protein
LAWYLIEHISIISVVEHTAFTAVLARADLLALFPLRLGDVVVVAMAKTPLLERLPPASKSAFFIPFRVGMAMRINAELLMLAQKQKDEGMVM